MTDTLCTTVIWEIWGTRYALYKILKIHNVQSVSISVIIMIDTLCTDIYTNRYALYKTTPRDTLCTESVQSVSGNFFFVQSVSIYVK